MGGPCRERALIIAATAVLLAAAGCAGQTDSRPAGSDVAGSAAWSIGSSSEGSLAGSIASGSETALLPLPQTPPALDARRVALGRALFADRRLSQDGRVACSDCHQLAFGGGNGQRKSQLPNRPPVVVNVPTIFNLSYTFRYAWNGRFERLEDQIDFALTVPSAMGNDWSHVVASLTRDAGLRAAFRAAYPAGLDAASARDALAVYVRSLVTPNARFDRYLRGELSLSAQERRGYERFRDYGCVSCHQGANIGGNMFERFGVMRDYFADRGGLEPADMGRYAATKQDRDRHVFRVPSLRNVALTAPYFHDGSTATLGEAIAKMGRYQLGRELSGEDIAEIAAFLHTLTGELPGREAAVAGHIGGSP
ncbi:MAG TPA: cytochrome c peroxidase [Polyangiales bacterium]|nr:cytochrome c peroxidase [Polyangiales bacterium]